MSTVQTGGGAATQAGTDYQNRVAAWYAVRILAERAATVPLACPATATLKFLRCETGEPIDDVLVGLSTSGHIFLQAKHRISLGTTADSELAGVIDQCVRQFLAYPAPTKSAPWQKPLDGNLDRLVLATTSSSSGPIKDGLPILFDRVRKLAPQQSLDSAAVTKDEQDSLATLKQHVTVAWKSVKGADPTPNEIAHFLALIWVQVLDVDAEETHEREAKDLLRNAVLINQADADGAWRTIVSACATFAANRTGASLFELQRLLTDAAIDIKATTSFQGDVDKLKALSATNLQSLASLSEIKLAPGRVLKIARDSTATLVQAAKQKSLVVVGQPGSGKSGALHDLAVALLRDGDVIILGVDHFEALSLGSLRNEMGCTHEVIEVLQNWPGTKPAFLIIDALDAARTDAGAKTFRELIAAVLALSSRWRVIPSIRKYDLRYSGELKRLFAGSPPSSLADPEFKNVQHLDIPILSDIELAAFAAQSSLLSGVIAYASSELKDLLRIPFNLRLSAELIGTGTALAAISPIRTQLDLLDLYWRERVIGVDGQGDARESVLLTATAGMVEKRTLRIVRTLVSADPSASAALRQILSSQVLIEWQQTPHTAPDRYIITYSHHILYDYAVSLLLLRGPLGPTVMRLEIEPDLILAIRPSLVFHFQHLWASDDSRGVFWECVLAFFGSSKIPAIGKIIGPLVAAQLASDLKDFQPLLNSLKDEKADSHDASIEAFRHLLGAAHSANSSKTRLLVGQNAAPWAELLKEVAAI